MTNDITYTYRVDGCYMGHVASYDAEMGHGILDCNLPKYQAPRPFTIEFFVRDYKGQNKRTGTLYLYQNGVEIDKHDKSYHTDETFIRHTFDELMEDMPIKMVYIDKLTSKLICQRTTFLSLNDTGIFPSETETELQGVIDQIETGKNELTSSLAGITGDISDLTSSISSTVTNKLNSLSTSFNDLFNLDDGTYVSYLNDIKHSVDNISFPDLSGLSDSVDDLKDSIGNITFPDLSGLSNTLDSVKTTLDNLSFPRLSEISDLISNLKNDIEGFSTAIKSSMAWERNQIFYYIDSGIRGLKSDIIKEIDDIKIEIPDISFPDLSFITDGFNNVQETINGLNFPTLKDIKTEFENTAANIADKILERILDEIERRYNK